MYATKVRKSKSTLKAFRLPILRHFIYYIVKHMSKLCREKIRTDFFMMLFD